MRNFIILFLRKSVDKLGFVALSANSHEEALALFHKAFEPEGEDYKPIMLAENPEDLRK